MENMKLTTDEEEIIPISNEGTVKNTLRRAWRLDDKLRIMEVGPNLFQFKFQSEFDLYRDFLRAIGSRPRSSLTQNTDTGFSFNADTGMRLNSQHVDNARINGTAYVKEVAAMFVEVNPVSLGMMPNVQQVDNAENYCTTNVKGVNASSLEKGLDFQENNDLNGDNVIMKAGFLSDRTDGVVVDSSLSSTKGNASEYEIASEHQRLDKIGSLPFPLKPKSTWTRINRMDFGLSGSLRP
uniref:Uncharacterized protein n=1 Tax=Quercus lobata TaxID=97700 RepID=A0A7N2LHN4_QUELO